MYRILGHLRRISRRFAALQAPHMSQFDC